MGEESLIVVDSNNWKLVPVKEVPGSSKSGRSKYLKILRKFMDNKSMMALLDIDHPAGTTNGQYMSICAALRYQVHKHSLPVSVLYRDGDIYLMRTTARRNNA